MSPKRAAGVGMLGGLAGAALAAAAAGGRLAPAGAAAAAEDERHDRARGAGRAGPGPPRPLGRAPRRGRRAADLWFAQGFCHGQDRLWQMDFYRRVVARPGLRDGRARRRLPVDRLMRTLGIRRAAEREAAALDPELRGRASSASAPGSTPPPPSARALPFEMQLLRLALRALAAGRHPQPRQAARLRPLDQLGAGAAARRHGPGARARSWRRRLDPGYPADNPVVTQEAWSGDGPGAGRADRRRAPLDRAGRRGERLQQLGGLRRAAARPARR